MDEKTLISIIENEGFTFYDTEIANENSHNIYRVYITKKGGVTLDDCAHINNIISPLLDVKPPIKGQYFLEVSSPGIERKLKQPHHFIGSVGETIEIQLINTDTIVGELVEADKTSFTIKENNTLLSFPYDEINKAKTYVAW